MIGFTRGGARTLGGVDHLIDTLMLNADSRHAAGLFLDACGRDGALEPGVGEEIERLFLQRLLPRLDALPKLPEGLIAVMIRRFHWPDTVAAAERDPALDAEVKALLARHARETWAVTDAGRLVPVQVDRALKRRTALALLGAVLLVAAGIAAKLLMVALQNSEMNAWPR